MVLVGDTADSRKDSRLETLGSLLRPGTGHCMAPVSDVSDAGLYTIACYSPGITLRPGQVCIACIATLTQVQ